jgi:ADP-ribose pyrophosphatase
MSDHHNHRRARDASVIVARDQDGRVAVLRADFPKHGGEYLFSFPVGAEKTVRRPKSVAAGSFGRRPGSAPTSGTHSVRTR